MDLYDALAAGTSIEELERVFQKDLAAAKEKLKKEKEKAAAEERIRILAEQKKKEQEEKLKQKKEKQEKELKKERGYLIEDGINYLFVLFRDFIDEEDEKETYEALKKEFNQKLEEFEKIFLPLSRMDFSSFFEHEDSDAEIIKEFLKNI